MTTGSPDALALMLRDIWREVLSLDDASVDDDFFELGGDSYQAVAMLDAVEARTGARLPASMLLSSPTPAQLARRLSARVAPRDGGRVVPLNASGNLSPVFAVHGTGDVLFYAPLSDALGSARPFYALQALPSDDDNWPASIDAIAAEYVAELKRIRPNGPYVLVGFCIGSTIAFAMAHALRRSGDDVEALILVDTAPRMPPRTLDQVRALAHRIAYLASRTVVHARRRTLPATVDRWLGRGQTSSCRREPNVPSRLDHYTRLDRQYRGERYDGRLIYVISSGFARRPGAEIHERNARRIAGRRLVVVTSDAGHDEQFRNPAVSTLAARLEAALSKGHAR